MKIMTQKVVDAVEDMRCDVCGVSTSGGGDRPPLNLANSEPNGDMDLVMMANDMRCTCAKAAFSPLWQH